MNVSEMLKTISEMPLGEERGLADLNEWIQELTPNEKIKLMAMGEFIAKTIEGKGDFGENMSRKPLKYSFERLDSNEQYQVRLNGEFVTYVERANSAEVDAWLKEQGYFSREHFYQVAKRKKN